MTTDIFIKTCARDAGYHDYCMQSIGRFCRGFRDTVVVRTEHPQGYLEQQVVKMHADTYSDADYFLVTDSDTLFVHPVTPESFMRDGKPVWHHEDFMRVCGGDPNTVCWFKVMKDFFGEDPKHEFMRRQPFMFPRWILGELRDFCFKKHGRTLEQYIYEYGRFTEWNILGMFAWLHHRDAFHWHDTGVSVPPEQAHQFWSHAPLEKNKPHMLAILNT